MPTLAISLTIPLLSGGTTSGLLQKPVSAKACYVFAHGAGAGMDHAFMAAIAQGLAERSIASLRFNFPFMEHGSKRPDSLPLRMQSFGRPSLKRRGKCLMCRCLSVASRTAGA